MPQRERKHLERLQRLIRATGYMKALREREVHAARARQKALEEKRDALLMAMAGNDAAADRLSELLRRNLDETARAAREAEAAKERGERALRRESAREKHIRRIADRAGRILRDHEARDELLNAIEQSLRRLR